MWDLVIVAVQAIITCLQFIDEKLHASSAAFLVGRSVQKGPIGALYFRTSVAVKLMARDFLAIPSTRVRSLHPPSATMGVSPAFSSEMVMTGTNRYATSTAQADDSVIMNLTDTDRFVILFLAFALLLTSITFLWFCLAKNKYYESRISSMEETIRAQASELSTLRTLTQGFSFEDCISQFCKDLDLPAQITGALELEVLRARLHELPRNLTEQTKVDTLRAKLSTLPETLIRKSNIGLLLSQLIKELDLKTLRSSLSQIPNDIVKGLNMGNFDGMMATLSEKLLKSSELSSDLVKQLSVVPAEVAKTLNLEAIHDRLSSISADILEDLRKELPEDIAKSLAIQRIQTQLSHLSQELEKRPVAKDIDDTFDKLFKNLTKVSGEQAFPKTPAQVNGVSNGTQDHDEASSSTEKRNPPADPRPHFSPGINTESKSHPVEDANEGKSPAKPAANRADPSTALKDIPAAEDPSTDPASGQSRSPFPEVRRRVGDGLTNPNSNTHDFYLHGMNRNGDRAPLSAPKGPKAFVENQNAINQAINQAKAANHGSNAPANAPKGPKAMRTGQAQNPSDNKMDRGSPNNGQPSEHTSTDKISGDATNKGTNDTGRMNGPSDKAPAADSATDGTVKNGNENLEPPKDSSNETPITDLHTDKARHDVAGDDKPTESSSGEASKAGNASEEPRHDDANKSKTTKNPADDNVPGANAGVNYVRNPTIQGRATSNLPPPKPKDEGGFTQPLLPRQMNGGDGNNPAGSRAPNGGHGPRPRNNGRSGRGRGGRRREPPMRIEDMASLLTPTRTEVR